MAEAGEAIEVDVLRAKRSISPSSSQTLSAAFFLDTERSH